MLVLGGVALLSFLIVEGYIAKLPIIPGRLLKVRSIAILLALGFLHDFVWQATQYFLPLYFQDTRGYDPLGSAILILPYVLAQCLAGAFSGFIMSQFARYAYQSSSFEK